MTVAEAAALLRVSRLRVYDLAREGRLGGVVRLGRQIRIDAARLRAWIEAGGEGLAGGWRNEPGTIPEIHA